MSYDTSSIRNVVLMGHSGCGKTSFAESMLYESGSISRMGSVADGTTTSDYTNIEKEKGNSIFSTLMHAKWRDNKINIIDTPGFDDFVGEVIASLKVADTGVLMVNAAHGVEVGTELLWEYGETFGTPMIFVMNQMDQDKADYDLTLSQINDRFGNNVIPFQYPTRTGAGFNAIIDALRMVMYVFPDGGGKPEKKAIPEAEINRANEMHNTIVEAAAENDEGLMEKYFDAGTLTEAELTKGLRIALAQRQIFPLFIASAVRNMGSGRIMGFINDICPSPADCNPTPLANGGTLICDAKDPDTTVFIYKTLSEPQVGMVSYFKVYSGTLKQGDDLYNLDHHQAERFNQLFVAEGKNRIAVDELKAGDIGVSVKLKDSHTNDTLGPKGSGKKIDPIQFPAARIRGAVVPPGKSDMEKLIKALHQIQEEDPTVILEQSPELKQTIVHGQGQLHLDLIKYRVEKVKGIHMEFEAPRIPYRETITATANEVYRHKKQSGGSGQFAEVHMRIEPYTENMPDPAGLSVRNKEVEDLDWGGKLAFYWCIVGGSIDSKYSNAIKKGVMQKMQEGPLTGSCCQNIRVSVYDGKMHSVDSNDMAFMIAAASAFKQGFKDAKPMILEPLYEVTVLCSDHVLGDVMGDLQTRRAMIMGMDAEGHYQKIIARVPLAELYQYSSTLRSITQGKAKYTKRFVDYQAVTPDIQQKLIEAHKEEMVEA